MPWQRNCEILGEFCKRFISTIDIFWIFFPYFIPYLLFPNNLKKGWYKKMWGQIKLLKTFGSCKVKLKMYVRKPSAKRFINRLRRHLSLERKTFFGIVSRPTKLCFLHAHHFYCCARQTPSRIGWLVIYTLFIMKPNFALWLTKNWWVRSHDLVQSYLPTTSWSLICPPAFWWANKEFGGRIRVEESGGSGSASPFSVCTWLKSTNFVLALFIDIRPRFKNCQKVCKSLAVL